MWSDTLITASFLLSKVLFCIFFIQPFLNFSFFSCSIDCLHCVFFKVSMQIHSRGGERLLCSSLSIRQQALKGKFTHNWNCLLKAGVLFSNLTQPFWSLVDWRSLPMLRKPTVALGSVCKRKKKKWKKLTDDMFLLARSMSESSHKCGKLVYMLLIILARAHMEAPLAGRLKWVFR